MKCAASIIAPKSRDRPRIKVIINIGFKDPIPLSIVPGLTRGSGGNDFMP